MRCDKLLDSCFCQERNAIRLQTPRLAVSQPEGDHDLPDLCQMSSLLREWMDLW